MQKACTVDEVVDQKMVSGEWIAGIEQKLYISIFGGRRFTVSLILFTKECFYEEWEVSSSIVGIARSFSTCRATGRFLVFLIPPKKERKNGKLALILTCLPYRTLLYMNNTDPILTSIPTCGKYSWVLVL